MAALESKRLAAEQRAQRWSDEVTELQNRIPSLQARFSELHSRVQQLRVDVKKKFEDSGHPYPCPEGARRSNCTHTALIAGFDQWLKERQQELSAKEAEKARVSRSIASIESDLVRSRAERDSAIANRDDIAQELAPRRAGYNRSYLDWWQRWKELVLDPAFAETTALAAQSQIDLDLMLQRLNLMKP